MAPSVCMMAVSTLTRGGLAMVCRAIAITAGILSIRAEAFFRLTDRGSEDWVRSR